MAILQQHSCKLPQISRYATPNWKFLYALAVWNPFCMFTIPAMILNFKLCLFHLLHSFGKTQNPRFSATTKIAITALAVARRRNIAKSLPEE
jgi:hypothetical protein